MTTEKKIVRTRFAPSPTGYLHVGSARTALFSWLYARHHHGVFVLRIEDTDQERSTVPSVQAILDAMEWLGLDYDEGPFYQSQRMARYQEVIEQLIKEGKAYRCYCSKVRLDEMREQQLAEKHKPRYDGHCRDMGHEHKHQAHVVRFRNPTDGVVSFDDMVRGPITVSNDELDDLVIARSDGVPTYNFAVVVDDWDMKITHVIRGDDHINNTPRQINILRALGADLPHYAHVPMILGTDGKRLSKRHGAVSVMEYRESGFLPDAILNYLVRLGWSHGDQEVFSRENMMELFNLKSINNSPACFNNEKLAWLNQHYMKTLDPHYVAKPLAQQFKSMEVSYEHGPSLENIVTVQAERTKTIKEMAEKSCYFYASVDEYDAKAAQKNLTADFLPALQEVRQRFADLDEWGKEHLHRVLLEVAEQYQLNIGKVAQPIRVAVTGNTVSPPIDITLELIGREPVLLRLDKALSYIKQQG